MVYNHVDPSIYRKPFTTAAENPAYPNLFVKPKAPSFTDALFGSAREAFSKAKDKATDLADDLLDTSDPLKPKPKPIVSHGGSGGSAKQALKYYEAPLAEYYGFGKETAYQEALANTSYRRELNDIRKAGLNPSVIYGSHNTTGADSNAIPRSSGGGGGGGFRRYGSSRAGLSKVAYYGIQLASTAVGAALGGARGASVGARVGLTSARLIGALKGR